MSHRGDLTERLVRIPLLLAERPRSQQELAHEFNVDGITIRRNLNELSRFYCITDERRGRPGLLFPMMPRGVEHEINDEYLYGDLW